MSLDPRFVPLYTLQQYFVDKTTGLPLANGQVFFYQDINRNVLKPVYEITGVPPNYSYNQLPNPVQLSGVGTPIDNNGNDIVIYAFPFDDTPATTKGIVDLYYVVVQDQFGVVQFTREGVPNQTTSANPTGVELTNFAPNAQFLFHNNFQPTNANLPTFNYGTYTTKVFQLAPGGWTYEVSNGTTAQDAISFTRNISYVNPPTSSPRYVLNAVRNSISADAQCDVRIKFFDVNKFANIDGNTKYTFLFFAQSKSGSDLNNVNVLLIKYFGSGGSTTTETVLTSSPITFLNSQWQQYAISVDFSTNGTAIVGPNDDDFVQLAIRFPTSGTFSVQLDDFMLTPGNIQKGSFFPAETNGAFLLDSLSNAAPATNNFSSAQYAEDGSNLYLPIVQTVSGLTYDYSQIGTIYGKLYSTPIGNELLCNGDNFKTTDYSSLGIPYARLQKVLFNSVTNGPMFGTGPKWVNCYNSTGTTSLLILAENSLGLNTSPTEGGIPTGFTFIADFNAGQASGINFESFSNSKPFLTSISTFTAAANKTAADNTTGMTVGDYNSFSLGGIYYIWTISANFKTSVQLSNGVGAGKSFFFSDNAIDYYLWYHTNTETDPAIAGRTAIRCNLPNSGSFPLSTIDVQYVTAATINRFQTNYINCIAAPPAGSWFQFNSNNNTFINIVWYKVNSVGTQPTVTGATNYIEVDLTGAETAAQVAFKTQTAINSFYFAIPDLRGQFLRGADQTSIWDIDQGTRWGVYNNTRADVLGTFEADQIINHRSTTSIAASGNQITMTSSERKLNEGGFSFDTWPTATNGNNPQPTIYANGATFNISAAGCTTTTSGGSQAGSETRPVNFAVNWFIKY